MEAEILTRVAEELDDGAPSVERADVLSSLAVRSMHDDGPEAAMPLISDACDILEHLQRAQALASAQMFLAHAQLLSDQPDEALSTSEKVLSAPTNRAVRGAMNMLRATVHYNQDRPEKAAAEAISSAEMYSGLRGAQRSSFGGRSAGRHQREPGSGRGGGAGVAGLRAAGRAG